MTLVHVYVPIQLHNTVSRLIVLQCVRYHTINQQLLQMHLAIHVALKIHALSPFDDNQVIVARKNSPA